VRNVLVTGGAGFIGSNFIHFIQQLESDVFVFNLDALTYAANPHNLCNLPDSSRYQFIRGDICNRDLVASVLSDNLIGTIIHFAAESHVDRSILEPDRFIQTNIVGTFALLEAARQTWMDKGSAPLAGVRFHHVSTDEVYGSLRPGDAPFTEGSSYAPNSPYAASKAASDHLVRSYARTYGLPTTITNCSNNYGRFQFPEKLIPLTIMNALNSSPLPVYGDGLQIRDWLYVEDHCRAIWKVVTQGQIGETYLVGGGNQWTNLQVIKEICGILDDLAPDPRVGRRESLIQLVPDRPGHDRRYAIDTRRIDQELAWSPAEDLRSGLKTTVRWYLENMEWVRAIQSRADYQAWFYKNYGARGERS
jgi:dTDP-glucose 4,6-dehydratase